MWSGDIRLDPGSGRPFPNGWVEDVKKQTKTNPLFNCFGCGQHCFVANNKQLHSSVARDIFSHLKVNPITINGNFNSNRYR